MTRVAEGGNDGHRPFRELTKHFTAKDRAYHEAGKARLRDEVKAARGRNAPDGSRRGVMKARRAGGEREAPT